MLVGSVKFQTYGGGMAQKYEITITIYNKMVIVNSETDRICTFIFQDANDDYLYYWIKRHIKRKLQDIKDFELGVR